MFQSTVTTWRSYAPIHSILLFILALLLWFIAPHAHAQSNCDSKYAASGVYPADPLCPLQAASADFSGTGGFTCGEPTVIAAYCSGPSGGTTAGSGTPDETVTINGDGTDDKPDGAGGSDTGEDSGGLGTDGSDIGGGSNSPDGDGGCGGGGSTAGCGSSTSGGDPVRLNTGAFHLVTHDLRVADTIGLDLARVYRSGAYETDGKPMAGAFGVGTTFNYDQYLTVSASDANKLQQLIQLYLPSGIRVPFTLRAGSTTTWDDLTSPGRFYRATITSSGSTKLLTLRNGRTMQFTMIAGIYRLTRIQDRIGNTVTIARDSKTGAVTSVSGPNGRKITFVSVVGARGKPLVSRVTDTLGRQISYQYDNQDRLTQTTDAGGGIWKYGWDTTSRLVTIADPLGRQRVLNTYDDADRVVGQQLADGSKFAMAYTVSASKITRTDVTDRRGSIRRVEFDANGRVVRNTYPAEQDIAQVQTFAYDDTGRMTNLTSTDRRYTFGYDANGNLITEADQYGTLVTRSFDSYSQLLTDARAGDPQRGVSIAYVYDAKGNQLTVTDRLGNRTTWTYDSQGRRLTKTDALKGLTKYSWTGADLTSITDPLNRVTKFTFDAIGQLTAVQDPLGNTIRRTIDALGRTSDITDAAGGISRLTWDSAGRLLSQADPKGVTTRYTYNEIGRPVTRTDPLGRSETYTWNSAGQIATIVDRKKQVTTYTYDPAGRTARIDFQPEAGKPGTRSWQYEWDQTLNKLTGMNDYGPSTHGSIRADGVIRSTIIRYDNITGKYRSMLDIPNIQGEPAYRYATDTREIVGIDMDRATVDYSRDAEHRVTKIQYTLNGEAPRTFTSTYDALGRLSQSESGNGIIATYSWDAASQLTGITYKRADGSVLGDLTYGYDLAGRRTKAAGSLAKVNLPQAVSDAQYNAANQLTRWAGKTFSYDLNGNLSSDGVNQYGWNEQGLLTQISGGTTAVFSYDAFGRRRDRTVNGHLMQTSWIGNELHFMMPDDDWSQRIRGFSSAPGNPLDELAYRRIGDDASRDRYVLRDANNNVIALTDGNQQSQTQYSYEPYGVTSQIGTVDPNGQQYTGRENDGTGLYYYRNRYYSPTTARFISEDPVGWASGQTNAYAYVNGNPVQLNDPFGFGSTGTPGNNQAQNKQVSDIVRELGLTKGQRRKLHDAITGQDYGYHEIKAIAIDMFCPTNN
jgi:RHS repeat-associated protein